MEPELSRSRTTSAPSRSTFSRTTPHCGRARARTTPVVASSTRTRRRRRSARLRCAPPAARGDGPPGGRRGRRRAARRASRPGPGEAAGGGRRASRARRRPCLHRGHAEAAREEKAGRREEEGAAEEERPVALLVAPEGRLLDLRGLETVDALEDLLAARRGRWRAKNSPPVRSAMLFSSSGSIWTSTMRRCTRISPVMGSLRRTGIGTSPPRPTSTV